MASAQESHRTCTSSPLTYLLGDLLISAEVCPAEAMQPSRSLRWPLEVGRATCPLKPRVPASGPGRGSGARPASSVTASVARAPLAHKVAAERLPAALAAGGAGSREPGGYAQVSIWSEKTGDTALPALPPLAHGLPNNLQGS